jgi:phage terminase large subunit-like protein
MPQNWTTACPDWAERIVARQSLVPSPPLHAGKAAEALGVFKSLQMTDLPMKKDGTWPTMGEVCEPFVFDLVGALFGAQDPVTGKSLVKEAMLLISKKNGKSTIAAGIMLTALILNWRHGAELLILAPTKEVANNSYNPAAAMVRADPELRTILKVIDHQRTIKHLGNSAELKVVSADSGTVGGKKAGFVLVDELWLFGKNHNAGPMLEEATGGQAARPEGWTLYLSTHSDDPPKGVFKDKLAYMRSVRDGEIVDPTTLPMLFEWPDEMIESEAYLEPANFYVTNPNIGKSPTVEFIARKLDQARAGQGTDGDTSIQIVLAKYLNVEIGLRMHRDRWRAADHWLASADPAISDLDAMLDRCEVAVAGIDGGGEDDLLGLCVAGRERMTDRWLFWHHAWAWPDVLKRRKDIASTLRDFEKDGDLTICDEESRLDQDALAAAMAGGESFDAPLPQDMADRVGIIARIKDRGLLPDEYAVAVDKVGSPMLVDALASIGVTDPQVYGQPQGYVLNGAIAGLPRMLKDGRALHGGRPLMAWCVSNAKVTYSGSALVMTKQAAGSMKIDPAIAMLNAFMALARRPEAGGPKESVYATRGLVVI